MENKEIKFYKLLVKFREGYLYANKDFGRAKSKQH